MPNELFRRTTVQTAVCAKPFAATISRGFFGDYFELMHPFSSQSQCPGGKASLLVRKVGDSTRAMVFVKWERNEAHPMQPSLELLSALDVVARDGQISHRGYLNGNDRGHSAMVDEGSYPDDGMRLLYEYKPEKVEGERGSGAQKYKIKLQITPDEIKSMRFTLRVDDFFGSADIEVLESAYGFDDIKTMVR